MALAPTIKAHVKNGCTKLSICDTTGAYDASTNTTGWGSPNVDPGDSGFAATIQVDSGTATAVTSQVPTTVSGNFTYDDLTVTLADGWHTIKYIISTTAAGSVSKTIKIFTYCTVKCCVFKEMLKLKDYDPCKDAGKIAVAMHMWSLYKSMIYAAAGCNQSDATELLTRLQTLCNNETDCGCS